MKREIKFIPPGKYFWLDGGGSLKSIQELYENIGNMNDALFSRCAFNNDFGKWLRDVFGDEEAYLKLLPLRTKKEYSAALKELIDNGSDIKDKFSVKADGIKSEQSQNGQTNYAQSINLEEVKDKGFAFQVDAYNTKYNELREGIKNSRKGGKDPYLAELHLMPFKAKLHIAEVTRNQKDLDIARNILITSEKELNEAEAENIIDVKKEIEEGARKLIEKDAAKEQVKN